jgi:hypothetical protein
VVRDRVARALADSSFHLSAVEHSAVSGYSLARLTKVHVAIIPVPHVRDSSVVLITGETYVGDLSRRDSISALPERWRLITASDASAGVLRALARTIAAEPPGQPGLEPAPSVRHPDAREQARLTATSVGRTVDLCTPVALPAGWLVLYWHSDPSRCPPGLGRAFANEPNVMRVEREF